ncbi:MAG: hypothetical protein M0P12_00420 [Paludibacteraceae bacterium]|nr:hypothetical protein [Paludibacteraceae bacterium]MCK9629770.1 hypothetical protein [Bacteroidales bacterium]
MPVRTEEKGGKWRVVETDGSIAKNNAGTAIDGGGHDTEAEAVAQVQAVNINMMKKSSYDMVAAVEKLSGYYERHAASLRDAERMMRPVMQKTIASLQKRFQNDGVDSVKLIKELPAQQAVNSNSYYQIAWYGLMTKQSPYGRCGTIQITTTYNNESDEQDITVSLRVKLGGDKSVVFPSSSPVGVVTKALNYVSQIERQNKGFDYWVKTYKPTNPKE